MQINKTTDYALRIIHYLCQEKRIVPSSEMAKSLHVSQRYLLSIAKKLKSHGYIAVSMGSGGGYSLSMPLSNIILYDIITALEGNIVLSRCRLPNNYCGIKACILDDAYDFLQSILERYLQTLTIEMLMEHSIDEWQNVIMSELCNMYRKQHEIDKTSSI